ncbi:MAG: ribonuclease [Actinomycetota bacterium]|nr:ribonuclease [Actinomycetota bacterium]
MANLYAYERSLAKAGLEPVAGADEAGRGACAGPLVVGAVMLAAGRPGQVPGLADSKLLTPAARERVYAQVVKRALAWTAVVIPASEVDRIGLHKANIEGMRRAVAGLPVRPAYVLTDGFPVAGIGAPGLAMWKGDQVAACIAAASVIAKVTRDRMMIAMHDDFPAYGFAGHKGYITREHQLALTEHGPCAQHRRSFINVVRAGANGRIEARLVIPEQLDGEEPAGTGRAGDRGQAGHGGAEVGDNGLVSELADVR